MHKRQAKRAKKEARKAKRTKKWTRETRRIKNWVRKTKRQIKLEMQKIRRNTKQRRKKLPSKKK